MQQEWFSRYLRVECQSLFDQNFSSEIQMLNTSTYPISNDKLLTRVSKEKNAVISKVFNCQICGFQGEADEIADIRSNVRSIRHKTFTLWRCSQCHSLDCERISNYDTLYNEYPLRKQQLDYFLHAWYEVILKRLKAAGMKPQDFILDYGCGSGLFLSFLKEKGFVNSFGYDPHVKKFNQIEALNQRYDFVICLDVIEHDPDPLAFIKKLIKCLKQEGQVCIETPNADGINLRNPEAHIHALHLPYHVHLLTLNALKDLCQSQGLRPKAIYKKWYMNSWWPGTSRRFCESYMKLGGNDIDSAFDQITLLKIIKSFPLFFSFFFGYLYPDKKEDHMMVIYNYFPVEKVNE